jgi:hypothetical protein
LDATLVIVPALRTAIHMKSLYWKLAEWSGVERSGTDIDGKVRSEKGCKLLVYPTTYILS